MLCIPNSWRSLMEKPPLRIPAIGTCLYFLDKLMDKHFPQFSDRVAVIAIATALPGMAGYGFRSMLFGGLLVSLIILVINTWTEQL